MNKKRLFNRIKQEFLLFFEVMDMNKHAELGPYGQIRLKRRPPPSTYYYKLKRFEKHGLLKSKQIAAGNVFVLTEKAKKIRRKPAVKVLRRDGFSSLIIFDIPQEKRNARDTLRRFLIRNGYTQIKESTFLSPFMVSIDVLELIKELKLEQNVSTFSARADYLI